MPGTKINGSSNIALLDSKVVANLCTGILSIDSSPSVFIGTGAVSVLGIKVKVVSPAGITIKNYGNAYDTVPALSGGINTPVQVDVPTKNGKYQYGVYMFYVQITDSDLNTYEVIKSLNICAQPDYQSSCDSSVSMIADCNAGQLTVLMNAPPLYQGKTAQSESHDWTLYFPNDSGHSAQSSTVANFSVVLFEGVYILVGTMCATYAMGDNLFVSMGFNGDFTKNVKCVLDYTCIYPALEQLGQALNSDCSQSQKDQTSSIIFNALFLITKINIAVASGVDAGDDILELEKLLGTRCTCQCTSSPIRNSSPSGNIAIEGCNVTKVTTGLTDTYTINNYNFLIQVDPDQDIISISAPQLTDCTMVQTLYIDIEKLAVAVANFINTDENLQSFYVNLINESLNSVDYGSLGYTLNQWLNLTLPGKIQAIANKALAGGSCAATVTVPTLTHTGADVVLAFTATNAYTIEIYVDGVMQAVLLGTGTTVTLYGFADGLSHDYQVVPRCSNGQIGVARIGVINYIGCADINPLTLSSNNVSGATCPYDLTSLVSALPVGITQEWHTANNTSPSTLVSDPTSVISGVYFGFAKDASGCYSIVKQVTISCLTASECSAPQNLTAVHVIGSNTIEFQSAAFPPPGNSYTVKRRVASDPDVDGSYTTIGTPSFNSGTGKWQISDATTSAAILYVYRAISNCSGGPVYTDKQFAWSGCLAINYTPGSDRIQYVITYQNPSRTVKLKLYNSTMDVLYQEVTYTAGSPGITTNNFFYLAPSTIYNIVPQIYVGGLLVTTCPTITITTLDAENLNVANSVSGLSMTTLSGLVYTPTSGSLPLTFGNTLKGNITSPFSGIISFTVSGSYATSRARLYINGTLINCVDISTPGVKSISVVSYLTSQLLTLVLEPGTC
jgi:hypothetical protein